MEIINAIFLTFGTSLATGIVTFLFSRKRNNIDNIDAATEIWQKIVDKLERQVENLLLKVENLENENNNLKELISSLKDEIEILRKSDNKYRRLETKVKKYEKLLRNNYIDF